MCTYMHSSKQCKTMAEPRSACVAAELPDLREKPNQPLSFKFLKRNFGQTKPVSVLNV